MPVKLILLILLATFGCDQTTKHLAELHLKGAPSRSYLQDTVRLRYTENQGAFLGLGASWREEARYAVFILAAATFLVALTFWFFRGGHGRSVVSAIAWALVIGGGSGNLWDRLIREGQVVDFLNVGIGPLRTGIFNVADVALTAGALALLVHGFRVGPSPPSTSATPGPAGQ